MYKSFGGAVGRGPRTHHNFSIVPINPFVFAHFANCLTKLHTSVTFERHPQFAQLSFFTIVAHIFSVFAHIYR